MAFENVRPFRLDTGGFDNALSGFFDATRQRGIDDGTAQLAQIQQQGGGRNALMSWAQQNPQHPSAVQFTNALARDVINPPKADPMADLKRREAEARIKNLEGGGPVDEMKRLRMEEIRARIEQMRNKGTAPQGDERLQKLQEIGINPDSAEGRLYRATGKLPAAAYNTMALDDRRRESSGKIAEGLKNLSNMATTYDDESFQNAVGPFQGAVPDGLAGAVPINAARAWGEIANWYNGGKTAPSEIRSNIHGSVEALAAAIKPLIRAPGEGVWTDQDQARLVSVVGDLAQASSKEEYLRRLTAVRDRVKSNFNLDVPFEVPQAAPQAPASFAPRGAPSAPVQPTPQAIEALRANANNPQIRQQFEQKYGVPAAQFLGQ